VTSFTPASSPRKRIPRRGRAGHGSSRLGRVCFAVATLLAACTLTSEEFTPSLVNGDPLRPDAGSPALPEGCAAGAECCDARPCSAGATCRGGQCETPTPLADAGTGACLGSDCSGPPVVLAPSCDDGERNGDEEGVDCGGGCERNCAAATSCDDGQQSAGEEGVDCGGSCPPCPAPLPSCSDGAQNGDESALDCGGADCPRCAEGESCRTGGDCASGVCVEAACAAPSCTDATRNGAETGVDCGGNCPARCNTGAGCNTGLDCASGVCDGPCFGGLAACCQAPSCDDGLRNGTEPSVDCGNFACGLCPLGAPCSADEQCQGGLCQAGECSDPGSCTDGVQNGRETGVDCGGGTCGRCPDLAGCTQPSDCNNNNCDFRGICISCGDNVQDGTETGVDCGGADPFCRRCNLGERCIINSDCIDGSCFGGFC
jgi:hypothetical protein